MSNKTNQARLRSTLRRIAVRVKQGGHEVSRAVVFGAEAKWWHRNLDSDPDAAKHFKKGELEKLCSLNFHFKKVNNRFKKLGLS